MDELEFVDAHVHYWQPSAHGWWPGLSAFPPRLARDHLPGDHLAGVPGVRLAAAVHVSAATAPRAFLDEARWLGALHHATGAPAAIIGTLDPAGPFEQMERDLLAQAASPAFRGARVYEGLDPAAATTAPLFRLMGEHDWVFDLVVRPDGVDGLLPALAAAPGTAFVVEHCGWPDGEGRDLFRRWRGALARLAALPHVDCKLSGLPMALGTMDAARLRPWIETCLELFGTGRCFFGSNLPVDGVAGTPEQLMDAYREIAAPLPAAVRHALFAANARRRYRLDQHIRP